MAKRKKTTQCLDPSEITVGVPLLQLVHLEVSLLRLIQTFHEAGVNAVYQKITQLDPGEDPEVAAQDAVDLYNQLIEGQQAALEEYLSDQEELEEQAEEISDGDHPDKQRSLFDSDKGPTPPTVH